MSSIDEALKSGITKQNTYKDVEEKRGRKRMDNSLKARNNVTFYLTDADYELLMKYAELESDSVTAVSRRVIMQKVKKVLQKKEN